MTPCLICQKPIEKSTYNQKVCPGECRKKRKLQLARGRYQKVILTRICAAPSCTNEFAATSNNRQYCQTSCRKEASRMSQKEKAGIEPEPICKYELAPELAVFLAKRPGTFPQARAYVAEHPELIAA